LALPLAARLWAKLSGAKFVFALNLIVLQQKPFRDFERIASYDLGQLGLG
jgi:hypothetical protein